MEHYEMLQRLDALERRLEALEQHLSAEYSESKCLCAHCRRQQSQNV
jgi:hypothetical protein